MTDWIIDSADLLGDLSQECEHQEGVVCDVAQTRDDMGAIKYEAGILKGLVAALKLAEKACKVKGRLK